MEEHVQIKFGERNTVISFNRLIINKCQSLFILDNAQEVDTIAILSENSCQNPVIVYKK